MIFLHPTNFPEFHFIQWVITPSPGLRFFPTKAFYLSFNENTRNTTLYLLKIIVTKKSLNINERSWSSLNDGDRSEFHGFLTDPSSMASVHHISYVLVALRCLLHHQLGWGHPDWDSFVWEFVQHLQHNTDNIDIRLVSPVTSWKSRFRLDFALERALPAPWQVLPKVSVIPCWVPVST